MECGPVRPRTALVCLHSAPVLIGGRSLYVRVAGSVLHALRTLEHPRWEDFEYERADDAKNQNRLYWLGDGQTSDEKSESGNSESSSRVVASANMDGNSQTI